MKVVLKRTYSNKNETIGLLLIDGVLVAHVVEDEKRTVKVMGETRIPQGTYKIAFRSEGGHHAKYGKMFPQLHKGMLELQNVPGFQYILIHIGNTDEDTAGCLLVGQKAVIGKDLILEGSTLAYQNVYKIIADEISAGKEVTITILDSDDK
jgi:hypothetical protein